ncbi:site-2 protease family protein [Phycicoccus avicenniae]|uniref:site-2 protease family protein n=1 Tax=Phycicoccus avicenniae TaxID=2828860 RepID=UPI003D275309
MSTSPPAPTGALRIASVAGVPVYLERTWLLLAALFAYTGFQSGQGRGTEIAVAFAAWNVLSIFVAVVGHEVGHALTARGLGFRVHQVVATVWGGHTSYDATGATPGRSALVALSGPLVNVVLSVAGFAVAYSSGGLTSDLAWYFGLLNALLAVFNLLPGLPLDGGAAVQSLVWAVSGRRDLGLVVAGWVGRVVAVAVPVLLIGGPYLLSGRPDLFQTLVGLLMAWVLWSGATAAIRRANLERVLDTVRVADVAERAVVLDRATPLEVARTAPGFVVCLDDDSRPTLVLGLVPDGVPPATPVDALVTRVPDANVVEAEPEALVGPVLRAMTVTGVGLVVLTRGGAPWGVALASAVDAASKRVRSRT